MATLKQAEAIMNFANYQGWQASFDKAIKLSKKTAHQIISAAHSGEFSCLNKYRKQVEK